MFSGNFNFIVCLFEFHEFCAMCTAWVTFREWHLHWLLYWGWAEWKFEKLLSANQSKTITWTKDTAGIFDDDHDDDHDGDDGTWKIWEASKSPSVDVVQLKKCGGAIHLLVRIIMLLLLMMMTMTMIRMRTLMMMMMNSCLSLRDAEFLLDLLGEKSVVPSPYYWPENFLLGGGFDGFWESWMWGLWCWWEGYDGVERGSSDLHHIMYHTHIALML